MEAYNPEDSPDPFLDDEEIFHKRHAIDFLDSTADIVGETYVSGHNFVVTAINPECREESKFPFTNLKQGEMEEVKLLPIEEKKIKQIFSIDSKQNNEIEISKNGNFSYLFLLV